MKHLDLFSGIGGFALAVEAVWPKAEHIFCEIDTFCQRVLKKNFPNHPIHADIKKFKADDIGRIDLLTGGFPCQPFSQAGKQRGKEDDRYLWPEMFRVIKESKPTWIVGENVAGIINMALEQACVDLENEGYEVQPFVIPACAVNAPHRRDRVWIVAHCKGKRFREEGANSERPEERSTSENPLFSQDTNCERSGGRVEGGRQVLAGQCSQIENARSSWENDWPQVATELCRMDDGIPVELDGLKLTKSKHRAERLKSLGNAIVPQVAIEILKYIRLYE